MAIITISRGCYSHGKEIAEKVADMLGYECVSREILIEASQFFHVPEMKLLRSLHDAPSILGRITHGEDMYLSFVQAALLEHAKNDNLVYHGHAGHLLMPDISHVLKVRVMAELNQRIEFLQQKQKVPRDEATAFIKKEDQERAHWTRYLYKIDINDPQIYDIFLNIGRLTIPDACELLCAAAQSATFKATPESTKAINDLALSSHVRAALQAVCKAEVSANDGIVFIKVPAQKIRKTGYTSPMLQSFVKERIREDLIKEIEGIVEKIQDIKDVIYDVDVPYYS
ncbi:MAG: cytidylate kinase-like family protein [Deltaproteobacteria bacterium]|nr:MAG: cytidylate kinase-like family protein [Deltaproteobacteria bacterium]